MTLSPSLIEAEYQKLGHALGWRFLTCPEGNIDTSSVALVTINPGGRLFEPPNWSVEAGSAYVTESWKGRTPGHENLQRQVRRMFEVMNMRPEMILGGYLVPFRSQDWKSLSEKSASIRFGLGLWREVFARANIHTVIAFGKDTATHMTSILNATLHASHLAGWGEQIIEEYRFGTDGRLVVLPHLSRFSLFGRPKSEAAFRAAMAL